MTLLLCITMYLAQLLVVIAEIKILVYSKIVIRTVLTLQIYIVIALCSMYVRIIIISFCRYLCLGGHVQVR